MTGVAGSSVRLESRSEPALSYSIARLDVNIAWMDFETALERHDLEAATEAIFVWFDALKRLEAAS